MGSQRVRQDLETEHMHNLKKMLRSQELSLCSAVLNLSSKIHPSGSSIAFSGHLSCLIFCLVSRCPQIRKWSVSYFVCPQQWESVLPGPHQPKAWVKLKNLVLIVVTEKQSQRWDAGCEEGGQGEMFLGKWWTNQRRVQLTTVMPIWRVMSRPRHKCKDVWWGHCQPSSQFLTNWDSPRNPLSESLFRDSYLAGSSPWERITVMHSKTGEPCSAGLPKVEVLRSACSLLPQESFLPDYIPQVGSLSLWSPCTQSLVQCHLGFWGSGSPITVSTAQDGPTSGGPWGCLGPLGALTLLTQSLQPSSVLDVGAAETGATTSESEDALTLSPS